MNQLDHHRIELYLLFRRVYKRMSRAVSANLKFLGTTDPQFGVLRTLNEKSVASMGEISDWVLTCNANLTTLINRMEKNGLIERNINQDDKRIKCVSLTEKGKILAKQAIEPHRDYVAQMFSLLNEEDLKNLEIILKKIKKGIQV